MSDASATALLELPEDLMNADPEALKQALLAVAVGDGPVVVGAEGVTRVGTAALQLLLAFLRHAQARGREVQLRAPSRALLEALSGLGLDAEPALVRVLSSGAVA